MVRYLGLSITLGFLKRMEIMILKQMIMMKCILNWKDLSKVGYVLTQAFQEPAIIPKLLPLLLEKIAWDKAAWSEAAKTDPDFLNLGKSSMYLTNYI